MKLQCQFEQELLDAIAARRWPNRAEAQLREHVAHCGLCSDVAAIAGAFFEDRDCAQAEAVVPSSSAVWWRAQIRAREEAARVAARPLLIFQALATVVVAIVADCPGAGRVQLDPRLAHRVRRRRVLDAASRSQFFVDSQRRGLYHAAAPRGRGLSGARAGGGVSGAR